VLARLLSLLIVLVAAGAAHAADAPAAGGIPDLVGPRTLGVSAAIGAAAGNEGMYLNPAAVAARRRYSVETGVLVDRRGADTVGQFLGGSVVDSMSSPVMGGVSFLRAQKGAYTGNLWHASLGGPIAEGLFLGVTGKYMRVDGPSSSDAATVDAGLFWQVARLVSVGAAGYNLVPISNEAVAPLGAGAGLAIGSDQSLQLTGDWRADFDRGGETTNRYSAGVEVLLGRLVPIRAGYTRDETLGGRWWSLGAGLVSRNGVALDVGYRQSFEDESARTLAATLKVFLFQ
jgi:hypothetical protein